MKNIVTVTRDELTQRIRIAVDVDINSLYDSELKSAFEYMMFRANTVLDGEKRLEALLVGLHGLLDSTRKRREEELRKAAKQQAKAQQASPFLSHNQLQPGLASGGGSLVGALGSTANRGQSNIGAFSGLQNTNTQTVWVDDTLNSSVEALRQEMKEAVKELYKDEPPSKMKEVLSKFFRSHK